MAESNELDVVGGASAAPALARVLGPFDVTMLVMGSIIGAGVFQAPQRIAAGMGSLEGILAVWVLGGLIALTGALVFSELGAMLPRSGGEYVFIRAGAGRFAAFVFGWMLLTAIVSPAIAYVAGVFVDHLAALLTYFGAPAPRAAPERKGIAIALIALLALVNVRGVRLGANVQNVSMLAKVAGILVVIVLALAAASGWISRVAEPSAPASAAETQTWNWDGFGVALYGILFTYGGWQNVAAVASEIKAPGRNLPLGTLIGTTAVVVLYVLLNYALVTLLGVSGVAASATPVAAAAGAAVSWGEPLVAALVMVSTFGITQALLMLTPRIYFAMANDGVFLPLFARVHPRFGTPAAAIVLQGAFAIAHVFFAASISDLLEVCSICDWVFFTICGATLFILRRTRPDAPRPYRAWGYPVLPAIFLLSSAAALVRMAMSAKTEPALQAGGLFVIGAVLYLIWRRRAPLRPSAIPSASPTSGDPQ